MINYYDVFYDRCAKLGKNSKEYIQKNAHMNFLKVLESSPNSIELKKNNEETIFKALTLSNVDKDIKDIREFCIDKKERVKVGDFLKWDNSEWLIYNKEIDTVEAYDKFEAIYCQHHIKWIDKNGITQEVPAYTGGLASNLIKLFYNRSNSTVVLDPAENNYLSIITTAEKDIDLGQRIILGKRAWKMIESDYITVPGICYLSFTEDKLLTNDDNINNIDKIEEDTGVANKGEWIFSFDGLDKLPDVIELAIRTSFEVDPTIYLNGKKYSSNKDDIMVKIIGDAIDYDFNENKIIAKDIKDNQEIEFSMINDPTVKRIIKVNVHDAWNVQDIKNELIGDDSIKVGGRTAEYELCHFVDGVKITGKLIDEDFVKENNISDLFSLKIKSGNIIEVITNKNNKLGTVKLKAKFIIDDPNDLNDPYNEIVEKEIIIKSLWG